MQAELTTLCAAAGFVPTVRHEAEKTSTLVAAGLGVAIVPEPTSALDLAGVRYRRPGPDPFTANVVRVLRTIV